VARTSLAERQHRLEQQKARLQLEENRLRDAERKARTRRLIEAGGLLDKAGLLALDANALYGALLQLAAEAAGRRFEDVVAGALVAARLHEGES
jgi:hypothetical protein